MDDNKIDEILKAQFADLPTSLKNAATNPALKNRIKTISEKLGVTDETQQELAALETMMVIIAINPMKDFLRNLQASLGLPEEKIRQVGGEISEEFFKPIAEDLRKVNFEIEENAAQQEKANSIPVRTPQKSMPPTNLPTPPSPQSPPKPVNQVTQEPVYGIAPEMFGKKDEMEIKPADASTDLIAEKLTSVVKLPQEQKFIGTEQKTPKPPNYKGVDPYREPIE